jgi:hypothetical protein
MYSRMEMFALDGGGGGMVGGVVWCCSNRSVGVVGAF